jgi:hypothetical protein
MFRKLHTRISPASLLAMVALFVSLGGVSYAAATIGSGQIKDNSVRSKDVRNKTIAGKDVRTDTLGGAQIDEAALGKVPSAGLADNASSVDGHSAECPTGTTLFLGQCFETTSRPAAISVFAAYDDCANEGRYLPSPLALRAFRDHPGIDLTAPREYSDAISDDQLSGGGNVVEVITVANSGGVLGESNSTDRPYRCVAPLVR